MNIFDFNDYKDWLTNSITTNQETRGYQSKLAEAAGCQKTYLSQVLKTHVHLTPEHAMGLAIFWGFNESESDYWLELVHLGRTSFAPLKKKIQQRLDAIKRDREDLTKRFQKKTLDDQAAQAIYYSSWLYGALHMLVGLPEYRSIQSLAKRLNASNEVIIEKLDELEKLGLVLKKQNTYLPTEHDIHLSKNSTFNLMNHQNWRQRALIDAQDNKTDGVHYSAIQTLSRTDFLKVKEVILQCIDEQRKIIGPSQEEEVACFVCDWFRV